MKHRRFFLKKSALVSIILVGVLAAAGAYYYGYLKSTAPAPSEALRDQPVAQKQADLPDYSGIEVPQVVVRDLSIGDGEEIKSGSEIEIYYSAWVYDPAKPGNKGPSFSDNTSEKSPRQLTLGQNELVSGWEEGLLGMKVGGKRQLIIPATKAYGSTGVPGKIPPEAILLIDTTLISAQ